VRAEQPAEHQEQQRQQKQQQVIKVSTEKSASGSNGSSHRQYQTLASNLKALLFERQADSPDQHQKQRMQQWQQLEMA